MPLFTLPNLYQALALPNLPFSPTTNQPRPRYVRSVAESSRFCNQHSATPGWVSASNFRLIYVFETTEEENLPTYTFCSMVAHVNWALAWFHTLLTDSLRVNLFRKFG